jgi:hypothetical protein
MRHHVVIGCEHGQNDPSNEKASQDADRERDEIPGGEGHCVEVGGVARKRVRPYFPPMRA